MDASEKNCPLCKQSNACNVADAKNCWCMTTPIPKRVIDKLPKEQRNISCICQACIEKLSAKV